MLKKKKKKKKTEKNRKSRDFRDISRSAERMFFDRTPIRKKKSPRFSNGNFRRQKIFHGKSSFLDFCKKIGKNIKIFGNEEYRSKVKKIRQIFRLQVRENGTEITAGKICIKKRVKNRYSRNFQRSFTKLSEIMSLSLSRRCPKRPKHPSNISAFARGSVEKSDF